MSARLEFISLGEQTIGGVPVRCLPASAPSAGALYRRRLEAMRSSKADYLCFVDGIEDECTPGFAEAMQALADCGQPLGYAAELVRGAPRAAPVFSLDAFLFDHTIIHHGVVCQREALLAIDWPEGCHLWEVIAHGTLAQQGFAHDPVPRYDWRPGPDGARRWADTGRAIINSKRWLQGLPGVHFPRDF